MQYVLFIAALICIYLVLASSLNVSMGYGGMVSLAHAVFFGIGAYTYALHGQQFGNAFLTGACLSVFVSGSIAFVFAAICVRLREDHFLLATISLQMFFEGVAKNWIDLTGGPFGITGIPRPRIFGIQISGNGQLVVLFCILAIVVLVTVKAFTRFRLALDAQAVRDDPIAASAAGINPWLTRVLTFTLSAGLASVAGAMFAIWFTFVDPTSFALNESIAILVIVIAGGMATNLGPIIGALILVLLPEAIRFLPLPDLYEANFRQIVYGTILVGILAFRPEGFCGRLTME